MQCTVCNADTETISLGKAPVGGQKFHTLGESLSAPLMPLDLIFCPQCSMTHYRYVAEANSILARLYADQHSTYSILSQGNPYLQNLARRLTSTYKINNALKILEIGCNDGELLSIFQEEYGCDVVGVEPGQLFKEVWDKRRLHVINDYFDISTAGKLSSKTFDLIIIRHVLEHIQDPISFLAAVSMLVSENTILVLEFPYLPAIFRKRRFENMSYSHLNYFTTKSVNALISRFQLGILSAEEVDTDGGSVVICIQRGVNTPSQLIDSINRVDFSKFVKDQNSHCEYLHALLSEYPPEEVIGYGAGAKGPHLLSLFCLDKYITRVIDDNPAYHGRFIAGTRAQVVSRDDVDFERIKLVLNLAPTHSDAIRSRLGSAVQIVDIV